MWTVKGCHRKFGRFALFTIAKVGAGRQIDAKRKFPFQRYWSELSHYNKLKHFFSFLTQWQSSSFDVCNRTCTRQHMRHYFDPCKKKHVPFLFITLIVWDSGMKETKQRTETSNAMVDHFFLSLNVALPCMNSE